MIILFKQTTSLQVCMEKSHQINPYNREGSVARRSDAQRWGGRAASIKY